MGALTVVLLAEGAGEVGASALRGPQSTLQPGELGAGHVLLARALETRTPSIPRAAIRFVEPLRTLRGTRARGSQLHAAPLRRLLSYPSPTDRPDLMVVFVDADGQLSRQRELEALTSDLPGPPLIAVAVQEFEAWLLSDARAVTQVLAPNAPVPSACESEAPGAAKAWLNGAMTVAATARNLTTRELRVALAESADLPTIERTSKSFAGLLRRLRSLSL